MKGYIFVLLLLIFVNLFSDEILVNKVSLFKNGFGYFNTELILKNESKIKLSNIPVQVHGTFWISYPDGVEVKNIYSTKVEAEDYRDFEDISDLLKINIGKEIRVVLNKGSTKNGIIYQVNNKILLLKNSNGVDVISIDGIEGFTFSTIEISTEVPFNNEVTELNIELLKPSPGGKISIDFIARGISWSPSYIIDISQPDKAIFTAKALIINDAIDLINIDVDFITGFPGIEFADTDSPMAKTIDMDSFFSSLSSNHVRQDGNILVQSVMSNRAVFGSSAPVYNDPIEVEGTEDLFFYPISNVNLKKGNTAYIPLFTVETTYKHIYTLTIPNYTNDFGRIIDRENLNVFHSIRIKNNGSLPWTTAPAQFISNGSFVGQSTSGYVPPGAEGLIKINNAVNVSVHESEIETKRVRDSEKFDKYSYDFVALIGKIHIKNSQQHSISMEIDKTVNGNITSVSSNGNIVSIGKGMKKVNKTSTVDWNIKIEPMEEIVLSYNYNVYIRE